MGQKPFKKMSLGSTRLVLLASLVLLSLAPFSFSLTRRRLNVSSDKPKDEEPAPEKSVLPNPISFKRQLATFQVSSKTIKQDLELTKEQVPWGTYRNPELTWRNAPEGTKSFAIAITDPGNPNGYFAHMILKNISKETTSMSVDCRKTCPGEPVTNSWGKKHYKAPQQLYGIHNYHFMVYAIAAERLEAEDWNEFQKDLEYEALGVAEITAPFQHKTRVVEEKEEEKAKKDKAEAEKK